MQGALTDFDKAISLNPKDPASYERRAALHRIKGQTDKALADYEAALKLDPKNAATYYERGMLLAAQG